jgi:hypothetical protein
MIIRSKSPLKLTSKDVEIASKSENKGPKTQNYFE